MDIFSSPCDHVGPITIDRIPGKGRGVLASSDIQPGTLMMSCKPVHTWNSEAILELFANPKFPSFARDLRQLHPISLHDIPHDKQNFYDDKMEDLISRFPHLKGFGPELKRLLFVLDLNSFPSGLFLHLSFFNHSCAPNCVKLQPNRQGYSEVRAIAPIKKGDECCISYLDLMGLPCREERQRYLYENKMFYCTCTLCVDDRPFLESVLCSKTCGGEIRRGETVCRKCGSVFEGVDIEAKATQGLAIASRADALENDTSLPAFEQLTSLQQIHTKASDYLHPRHLALGRIHARMERLVMELLDGIQTMQRRGKDVAVQTVYLETGLRVAWELRQTQMLHLPKDDPIAGMENMRDIAQLLTLMAQIAPASLEQFPLWNTAEKALRGAAMFSGKVDALEKLYKLSS